jgi:hypothetical protein
MNATVGYLTDLCAVCPLFLGAFLSPLFFPGAFGGFIRPSSCKGVLSACFRCQGPSFQTSISSFAQMFAC